jgi:histidyl-tRNA synthetase
MTTLRSVKGMKDYLPKEVPAYRRIEEAFARVMQRSGFREMRTPIVEPTALFVRAIGEVTDVVEKEMYSFQHHDESLTLRPEGTAGVVRAYLQNNLGNDEPVTKVFYQGAMFRAERTQRGRYRQFHQLGAEVFGDPSPAADADLLATLVVFLREIGVSSPEVILGSIGGKATRAAFRESLVDFLTPKLETMSEESKRRILTNPLRILDSKHPGDRAACEGAPSILDVLDAEDQTHFDALRRYLDALAVPYRVDRGLVRGLDYYSRTLFEIKGATEKLGAGDTLLGGGRYDGLVEELGGRATPAIGFAAGLERLVIATEENVAPPRIDVFVASLGEGAVARALALANELRSHGISVECDGRGASIKAQLRRANAADARFAIVLGDREVSDGVAELKDLAARTAAPFPLAEMAAAAKAGLLRPPADADQVVSS